MFPNLPSIASFEIELISFSQTAPGEFEAFEIVLSDPTSFGYPGVVACPDLDGKGRFDLVLLKSGTNFASNPILYFQASPALLIDQALEGPFSLATGDLDGDEYLDLVSTNFLTQNLSIAFNEGARFSIAAGSLSIPDFSPASVDMADLDGDGDGDLHVVSTNPGNDNLTIFLNGGQGQFSITPTVVTGTGPFALN